MIKGTQTPEELRLEDDDLIDAFLQQVGGIQALQHAAGLWPFYPALTTVKSPFSLLDMP